VNWLANQAIRIEPGCRGRVLRINNISGILQATETGMGIAALPTMWPPNARASCGSCRRSKVPLSTCILSIATRFANPSASAPSATSWCACEGVEVLRRAFA